MSDEIKRNLDNPRQLEKMYRDNKSAFKREFNFIYQDIQENKTAQFWYERLNFEDEQISWGTNKELLFLNLSFTASRDNCQDTRLYIL